MLAIGILVIISGIPLLFLNYGNESAGAIDNASGLGLVLHLAALLAGWPDLVGKLRSHSSDYRCRGAGGERRAGIRAGE